MNTKERTGTSSPASEVSSKPGATGADKKQKELLQKRLAKVGINATGMTVKQMRNELSRIKKETGTVPDLRHENQGAPLSPSKDPKLVELRTKHLNEEVDVTIRDKKSNTMRVEKRGRLVAILDMLAQEALSQKSVPAAKEYLDRTLGKSKQEIELQGEIKVEEQREPTRAEKAAAAAYLKALDEE